MDKLENVIKGLECCRRGFCFACPYNDGIDENTDCKQRWADDVLSLLKAQQPHVMTLDEMNDERGRGEAVYYEDRDATCKSQDVFVIAPDKDIDVVWLKAETYTLAAKMSTMGKTWRCWTYRPDEKRRAETPWES